MWNDIRLLNKAAMTRKVNGLFYYLQKLPLIGSHIPNRVYQFQKLKNILSIFAFLIQFALSILKNLFYLLICYMVPLAFAYGDNNMNIQVQNTFLISFLLLSGCMGALSNGALWTIDSDAYIMTRLLQMEAKRYLLHHAMYVYLRNTLTLALASCLTSLMFQLPFWYGLLCGLLYLTSHVTADTLYLILYDKKGIILTLNNKYKITMNLTLIILTYGLMALHSSLAIAKGVFIAVTMVCTLASIVSVRYLKKSNSYKNILIPLLQQLASLDLLDANKGDMMNQDVKLDEKDYSTEELRKGISSKQHGYAYMNALFFQRHKRLVYTPIKRRIVIILCITAGLTLLSFFVKDFIEPVDLIKLLPPFVFISYIFNISEKTCRAMFMNCDVSLLHYGYYRQPKAILENFWIRLKTLSGYNLMLTALLCLAINLLAVLFSISFTKQTLILFDLTLITLSIFFSTHYLFVYYIFQPYNEEFDMKNPFMKILNGIVYLLCYFCLQLEGNIWFAFGVLLATLVYIPLALLLVWRLSPKTFHLK